MKAVIGCLAGMMVAYLAGAFVMWDFNPGDWPEGARFAVAALALPFSIGGAVANKFEGKV